MKIGIAERTKQITIKDKTYTLAACGYENSRHWGHKAWCVENPNYRTFRTYWNRTWECNRFDNVLDGLEYKMRFALDAAFRKERRAVARDAKKRLAENRARLNA